MLSEPEPVALMNATHEVLAEELGRLERRIPDEMARALDENIFLFSGFKTYHEMNDASRLLKDEDGGFKSFDRFLQDVQAIDASYNQNWLYAEYNFATASTQMAAKWADIARDGDEYDLQYRTALDGLVRPEHAALEGITLPPSDKFWNEYYPPNGWNCRCTAVQVLKDKYPTSDSDQACEAGERATTQIGKNGENKAAMFRFNPGKEGKVFPPKHPYLPKGCGSCSYNKLSYNPSSEKCRACKVIQKNIDNATSNGKKARKENRTGIKRNYEEFVKTLPEVKIGDSISHQKDVTTADGEIIRVGKTFFNETFAKNIHNKQLKETIDLAIDFENWMPRLKDGIIENGIDHDFKFKAYEINHNGYDIVFKTKLTEGIIAYTMRIKKKPT